MKPINRIFLFLLFISVSYAISYAQENQSYFLHTIEKGQSLYSISKMYNVTTSDIIRLNPGCDEKIYAGQTIKIPTGKESQKGETFHTIQAGETLYKLTTMYNVSAKDICEANPGLSAENFRIGQVIVIPAKVTDSEEIIMNEVKAAQTTKPVTTSTPLKPNCRDMHKVERKEILRAQSGICLADALCGYSIALCQLVQGFTRLDGMEHLLFRSDVLLWNLQCFTGFNFLVAAGVHFNDITGSDIIHAGYGIKTLPFGNGVQEIAGRLCLSHHSGAAGRQGCDKI